ncbi:terminase small subunit [Gudongella sp. SC589]|uniref:terminase small subunit n=1 Tax=Gudongella sp. SC589 TaxID=3385990 RepID=UPI0039049903
MEKLTLKQEKFVQELISGKSQREAYRIAYPSSKKWKDENVDSQASNMLKIPKVFTRYQALQSRLKKEAEDEGIVSGKRVLKELAKIGFADIGNYLEYRPEKTIVDYDEDGKPIIGYQTIIEVLESKGVDTSAIQEVSITDKGTFKFKLYDKQRALELIGKNIGMFTDKVEHSGRIEGCNPFEGLTTAELKKLIQK